MRIRSLLRRWPVRWTGIFCSYWFLLLCLMKILKLYQQPAGVYTSQCNLQRINSPQTAQDDPCLLHIIRTIFLHPPSELPLNLSRPHVTNPSLGQSQKVVDILIRQNGGFFVEAGAFDGESYSNTLFMERSLNWNGLLVEPNPDSFSKLTRKHRRAWSVNAALSVVPYPKVVTFNKLWLPDLSSIVTSEGKMKADFIFVQSLPIYSILLALNRTTVDYFSLDVVGLELDILKTIPWSKVNIRTLTVDFSHIKEGTEALKDYMQLQGYRMEGEVLKSGSQMAYDMIFVKRF